MINPTALFARAKFIKMARVPMETKNGDVIAVHIILWMAIKMLADHHWVRKK